MEFSVVLASQSAIPMHRQLYDEIRRAILSGRLKKGQRLPSTRALAKMLAVSRVTTAAAYEYLAAEGYLQPTVGSGTYVSRSLPDDLLKTNLEQDQAVPVESKAEESKIAALSSYGTHLKEGNWLAYSGVEPEIQFSFGRPAMDHFPSRLWMQLMNEHWRRGNLAVLDSPAHSQGYGALREAIAAYLARARSVNCTADQIIIVNGSQQSIDLVTRLFVDRGDAVGLEEPGYIGARKVFEAHGAEIVPLAVDEQGLITERLKESEHRQLKLVYVTPSHQFPTGVVLSLPRRLELLACAERYGCYIVEDDYDSEYRYKGRPIPALAGLAHQQCVIYIGTFSKVLFPALRLGYLVAPTHLVQLFARAKWLSDMHAPLLEQQVLADFINSGHFDRHIRRMRSLYEQRRRSVILALKRHFADQVMVLGDSAGINVLIRFNVPIDDEHFAREALDLGVELPNTRQFYLSKVPVGEYLLNYGGLTDAVIEQGVCRLAQAFRRSCK